MHDKYDDKYDDKYGCYMSYWLAVSTFDLRWWCTETIKSVLFFEKWILLLYFWVSDPYFLGILLQWRQEKVFVATYFSGIDTNHKHQSSYKVLFAQSDDFIILR